MTDDTPSPTFTAFQGFRRLTSGTRSHILAYLQTQGISHASAQLLTFDDHNGEQVDLDMRPAASAGEEAPTRSVGRPRLGVVAREVTLMPRHWDWLSRQPGGASVALRRLIEETRRDYTERDAVHAAQEACYHFMIAMAGDLPGLEEAARALFASEQARFNSVLSDWPADVSAYARQLATGAWAAGPSAAH